MKKELSTKPHAQKVREATTKTDFLKFFELTEGQIKAIEEGEQVEYDNVWVILKDGEIYEATHSGLYRELYKDIDCLMYRTEKLMELEYCPEASEKNGEETFLPCPMVETGEKSEI